MKPEGWRRCGELPDRGRDLRFTPAVSRWQWNLKSRVAQTAMRRWKSKGCPRHGNELAKFIHPVIALLG
ncbi:MAG: hypothetical protein ACRD9Y_19000, partial [Blastocatellia bacterium]